MQEGMICTPKPTIDRISLRIGLFLHTCSHHVQNEINYFKKKKGNTKRKSTYTEMTAKPILRTTISVSWPNSPKLWTSRHFTLWLIKIVVVRESQQQTTRALADWLTDRPLARALIPPTKVIFDTKNIILGIEIIFSIIAVIILVISLIFLRGEVKLFLVYP